MKLYLVLSLPSITALLQIHLGEDDMDMMGLPVMYSYGTWLAQWKQYLTSSPCFVSCMSISSVNAPLVVWMELGLGNILIYRQYHKTGVCNNGYRRHFHISIISLMQYIAQYRNISQCCTIGLSTQSKYASTILKYFSSVTHNTHVDDT